MATRSPLRDYDGNIIGIIGTSIEITAEKKAEEMRIEIEQYKADKKIQGKFLKFIDIIQNNIQNFRLEVINEQLGIDNQNLQSCYKIILTKREEEILYLLSMGKSPKEIARILSKLGNKMVADSTIGSLINKQLYTKFEVANYGDLIAKATQLHLIPFMPASISNFLSRKFDDL